MRQISKLLNYNDFNLPSKRIFVMTKKTKIKLGFTGAVLFLGLSLVIFLFADGLRRWYSGIFFFILGGTMLSNAIYWRRHTDE